MFASRQSHFDQEDAFRRLFDVYKNRLIHSTSPSQVIAEVIAQEIGIELWLCGDVLVQTENIHGYIFKMARNKVLNHLRKPATDMKLLEKLQRQMNRENNNVQVDSMATEYDKQLQQAFALLSAQRRLVYQSSRSGATQFASCFTSSA